MMVKQLIQLQTTTKNELRQNWRGQNASVLLWVYRKWEPKKKFLSRRKFRRRRRRRRRPF